MSHEETPQHEIFRMGKSTYYLAYTVPLHVLTQFDLSFAQEAVNSCVFSKEPKVDGEE